MSATSETWSSSSITTKKSLISTILSYSLKINKYKTVKVRSKHCLQLTSVSVNLLNKTFTEKKTDCWKGKYYFPINSNLKTLKYLYFLSYIWRGFKYNVFSYSLYSDITKFKKYLLETPPMFLKIVHYLVNDSSFWFSDLLVTWFIIIIM